MARFNCRLIVKKNGSFSLPSILYIFGINPCTQYQWIHDDLKNVNASETCKHNFSCKVLHLKITCIGAEEMLLWWPMQTRLKLYWLPKNYWTRFEVWLARCSSHFLNLNQYVATYCTVCLRIFFHHYNPLQIELGF